MASKIAAVVALASSTAGIAVEAASFRSTSVLSRAVDPAITGEVASEASKLKNVHCGKHTLCGSCLLEPDCVWCADGEGSCVPGSSDKGPAEDSTCKDWESSYCVHEPCAAYSQCSTCTSDAFCGWSGSESVCVEGDSEGPLTGHDRNNKWVWSDCSVLVASKGATGGATGGDGIDNEASSALKEAENSVHSLEAGEKSAVANEQKMVKDEKKAFNVIKHLRAVIKAWKGRKAEISLAEHKDRELFQSAFNTMEADRKKNFEKLLDAYNHMSLSLEKDEELLRKRQEQEDKFNEADKNEDDRLEREGEASQTGATGGAFLLPEDHSMNKLEAWLKTMTAEELNMLRQLGRKASGNIEKEMHVAATRKQEREEASWYACSFKLSSPSANCMDFHSQYAGSMEKGQHDGLSEEEHMRVCNSVEAQLAKIPHVPVFKTDAAAGDAEKQKYLAWCVNNIHQ